MGAPEFWNDADKAKSISSKAAGLKKKLESFLKLEGRVADVEEGINLAKEFDDGDLAQEALLRVVAHLDRWERGPVLTWVLGVSRNVCFDHIRKRTRRRTDPAHTPPLPPTPDHQGVVATTQLLADLPHDQREALVLTQLLGLPYADAADVVGCPIGTIRSRVARARTALAAQLHPDTDQVRE